MALAVKKALTFSEWMAPKMSMLRVLLLTKPFYVFNKTKQQMFLPGFRVWGSQTVAKVQGRRKREKVGFILDPGVCFLPLNRKHFDLPVPGDGPAAMPERPKALSG